MNKIGLSDFANYESQKAAFAKMEAEGKLYPKSKSGKRTKSSSSKPNKKGSKKEKKVETFEGRMIIKWWKNHSGDKRPLTIDTKNEKTLKKELDRIKHKFMTEGENGNIPYSVKFDLSKRGGNPTPVKKTKSSQIKENKPKTAKTPHKSEEVTGKKEKKTERKASYKFDLVTPIMKKYPERFNNSIVRKYYLNIINRKPIYNCTDNCLTKGIEYVSGKYAVLDAMLKYGYDKVDKELLNEFGRDLLKTEIKNDYYEVLGIMSLYYGEEYYKELEKKTKSSQIKENKPKTAKSPHKSEEVTGKKEKKTERKAKPSNKKIKYEIGKTTEIDTQTENLKSKYAIMELENLVQSNDPITFKPNPKYPAECQTRNYNEIKGEQEKVIKYSSNFKPNHLINNSPDATTGSPIVTSQGIVLGGNGRTMILKRLNAENWDKYEKLLTEKVNDFGISQSELENFKKPVLVRLLENVSLSKCSYYSDTLNSNTMQDFDPVTKSISIAKSMDGATFERIANIFEDTEGDTFSQVLSVSTASNKIIELLTDKKFINTSNRDVWLDGNNLSSKGKETLENVLLAYILPDKKLIEKAKVYTNKITKALPLLVKIKQFKGQWNLIPDIQEVIKLENSRRATGQTKNDYLNQDDVFSKSDKPKVSEKEKLVWSLLDSGILKFKDALSSYVRTYENENSGNSMFGGGNATPIEVLENLKTVKGLSDDFKRLARRKRINKQTHVESQKKRNTTKYERKNLSDKPSTTKSTKKKVRLTFLDKFFGFTS